MTQLFTALASLLLVSSALACNCGDGAKAAYLKNVESRESKTITSRDGTLLKATFWGAEKEADVVPATASTPDPMPAPATVSSDLDSVKSFQLNFATNSTTPSTESLDQLSEIQNALASGEYKTVKIVGFADTTGSVAYNNRLSLIRAQEVQKLLKSAVTKRTALSTVGGGVREASDLDSARVVEVQLVR